MVLASVGRASTNRTILLLLLNHRLQGPRLSVLQPRRTGVLLLLFSLEHNGLHQCARGFCWRSVQENFVHKWVGREFLLLSQNANQPPSARDQIGSDFQYIFITSGQQGIIYVHIQQLTHSDRVVKTSNSMARANRAAPLDPNSGMRRVLL